MARTRGDASTKWLAQDSGEHYERGRFRSERARGRDGRSLLRLLDRCAGTERVQRLLDAPCGSGRWTRDLALRAERYIGADASRPMLEAARPKLDASGRPALALEALCERLPFRDRSFDVVVSCRFLHHLRTEAELAAAIAELARVSRGLVIVSFWDARSLPGLRRRLGLKRPEGPRGRVAHPRERIEALFAAAGAEVVAWSATLRFVSQQTFAAARVREPGA